jgi:hypothetical protein
MRFRSSFLQSNILEFYSLQVIRGRGWTGWVDDWITSISEQRIQTTLAPTYMDLFQRYKFEVIQHWRQGSRPG